MIKKYGGRTGRTPHMLNFRHYIQAVGGGDFTSRHGTVRGGLGGLTHGLVAAQGKNINFSCPSREWNLDPPVAVWHLYTPTLRCTFQYRAETRCYRSKQRTREGRLQTHNEFCIRKHTILAAYYQWQRLAGDEMRAKFTAAMETGVCTA